MAFGSPFMADSACHPPATFFVVVMLLSVSPACTFVAACHGRSRLLGGLGSCVGRGLGAALGAAFEAAFEGDDA